MAGSFGNTGSSSLLRSATAGQAKIATYNDASAAYEFDLSAKTADDYKKYSDYLSKRITSTQNVDPSKALTLQRTATSANRSFNSAEIGRATTNVEFGNMSNRDKYKQIANLYGAASANGDDNLAQSLYSRLASLSVTIQNEDKAAADAATTANTKAATALNKGYTQAISEREDGVKQLNAAKLSGQITPAEYNNQMAQLYLGNKATGEPGIIGLAQQAKGATGDPNGTYQSKLDGYASDAQVQKFVNGVGIAQNGVDNRFNQVITKNQDGTFGFQDRPANEITGQVVLKDANGQPLKDANGHVVTSNQYAAPQAGTDNKGNVNSFEYATNIDRSGNIAPGTGPGALRKVGSAEIHNDDPSGVPYFINEAGQKKFIGKDAANGHAIMANDPGVIKGDVPGGTDTGLIGNTAIGNPLSSAYWKNLGTSLGGTLGLNKGNPRRSDGQILSGGIGSLFNGNILGNLFNRNNQAQAIAQKALEARVAAQNATKDAATLAASRQVLPVFRPPAPVAPPKITAAPSQYNLPALPAPVPVTKGSTFTVPASTGNYQKDVLNLGRSLGGLL